MKLLDEYKQILKESRFDWYAGCALIGAAIGVIITRKNIGKDTINQIKTIAKAMLDEAEKPKKETIN